MKKVIVIFKVEDYDKWKRFFDNNTAFRKTHGSRECCIHRSIDNPNKIVLFYKWDSIDNAKKFFKSSEVKNKMKEAGVQGRTIIYYIDEVERTIA